MAEYSLGDEAEHDLLEIGRYTTHTWSVDQAVRYLSALEDHFAALAKKVALEKAVFDHREDYRVSQCQHHYVFFVREDEEHVLVLAVLHENMDLIARFRQRLERGSMGSRGPRSPPCAMTGPTSKLDDHGDLQQFSEPDLGRSSRPSRPMMSEGASPHCHHESVPDTPGGILSPQRGTGFFASHASPNVQRSSDLIGSSPPSATASTCRRVSVERSRGTRSNPTPMEPQRHAASSRWLLKAVAQHLTVRLRQTGARGTPQPSLQLGHSPKNP